MDKMLTLGIILSAKDAFSPTFSTLKGKLGDVGASLQSFSAKSAVIGTSLTAIGAATQGMSQTVLDSFISLEDARTQLENTLMKSDGSVSRYFKGINDEAMKLGDALPGTTADFYKMASTLKALGVEEKSIVGGALKSAAYLGVVLKIPYEEAATATAKFKEALGIADAELLPFIDDIQRLSHMGVQVGEMSFAFSKIGATMKGLGMTGLKAARDVEPLVGMLIKAGFSGETVGTNLGNIMKNAVGFKGSKQLDQMGIKLNFNDEAGNFKGTANMIKELEKLKAIKSDAARLSAIESIFGKGEASGMANVLIQNGTKGLAEFNKKMAEQADLNARVKKSSETLGNTLEAFTGTLSNMFAIMGETVAPALKGLTGWLNNATSSLSSFAKEHPIVTQGLTWVVVGLTAVTTAAGFTLIGISVVARSFAMMKAAALMTSGAVSFLGGIMRTVTMFMLTNPIGLAITGIATAAFLIYRYWAPIKGFFHGLWSGVKSAALSAFEILKVIFGWSPLGMVINSWSPIVGVFKSIIGMVTKPFSDFFTWIESKFNAVSNGLNTIGEFFGMSTPSPTPSRQTASQKVSSARNAVTARSGGTNNTVAVTINNPNFTSKEHAAQTQKQIDEQVRKAMARQANDKKDRSYS